MTQTFETKVSGRQFLLRLFGCTLISVGLLQAIYWHWPKALCFDATFSVFAAQNALVHGRFETIEPNKLVSPDLGTIHLQWLDSWPPLVSLVFAALLKCGLTAGGATNCFTAALLLGGTWLWILCFKESGAAAKALYCLAALIPWTAFPISAMTTFWNDFVLRAMAPGAFLLLLRLPISKAPSGCECWVRWPLTGLVCGLLVAAKYSALPLVLGSGIYFLCRDGWRLTAPKIGYAMWFGFFLLLPGAIVYLLNQLWTEQMTAQVHGSQPLFPVGLPQLGNLIVCR